MIIFSFLYYNLFSPIYTASEVIIDYGLNPFDICSENPDLWYLIKITFIFTFFISNLIISSFIFRRFLEPIFNNFISQKNNSSKNLKYDSASLNLLVGKNSDNSNIIVPEKGLYQNFIITGTIGSGKTSSAMYPVTEQIMK